MRISVSWSWLNQSLPPDCELPADGLEIASKSGISSSVASEAQVPHSPELAQPVLAADVELYPPPHAGFQPIPLNSLVPSPLEPLRHFDSLNTPFNGDRAPSPLNASSLIPQPSLPLPPALPPLQPLPTPQTLPTITDGVFAQVFERSPDAMTLSTLVDGRFVAVNQRFLELSEYPRQALIGVRSTDLNFWPNPAAREQQRQKIERQGALYNEEGEFRTQSGQIKTVTVSAEILTIDGCPCVLCSIRDITQEKHAEEQLQLANERDRLLGQISLNIRQSLDLEQILQSTVAEVRQFLGVERVFVARFGPGNRGSVAAESVASTYPSLAGEIISADIYDELVQVFSHTSLRVIDDMDSAAHTSHCFQLLVSRYQVKAGLAVPIPVNGALFGVLVAHQCQEPRPWTEFEQQLLQRLATQVAIAIQQSELYSQIRDFNVNLEQEVADRTQELEQRTQELEKLGHFRDFLLHAVTHDLRTTAVGTTMLLKSLATQPGSTIQMPRRLLQSMLQACGQQRDKLDAIREVHTLEIQGIPLHVAPLNCHTIVDNVMALLQPRAQANDAVLLNHLPPVLPNLRGDTVQLERVFHHLITNAIAHNPPGITITIQAQVPPPLPPSLLESLPVDHPGLDHPGLDHPGPIKFQVQDNGQGIAPEQRDRLFQLCSDCTESRQLSGIRLGLYLCHQIITAHGGTIGVESDRQHGTTIWFTLPTTAPRLL
ncbi:MAG: GAF domain-containing protein [Leptolyngbyaceae cyanobacterium]